MAVVIDLKDVSDEVKALIDSMHGEPIVFVDVEQTIATLLPSHPRSMAPRQPGLMKGMLKVVTEDDEHLEGFD